MRKLFSLIEFESRLALEDKLVFLYTLIFPAAYFLVVSWNNFAAGDQLSDSDITSSLFSFWGYIMVVGVVNQMTMVIFQMRENNFLKMYTFIAGDKRLIYYANLIPQTIILQVEIALFDLLAVVIYRPNSQLLQLMGACWLMNFLIIPVVAFFTSVILIMPLKLKTVSLFLTGYVLAALLLASFSFHSLLLTVILTLINPVDFQQNAYLLLVNHVHFLGNILMLTVIGLIYVILGNVIIAKMSLASRTSR